MKEQATGSEASLDKMNIVHVLNSVLLGLWIFIFIFKPVLFQYVPGLNMRKWNFYFVFREIKLNWLIHH